MTVYNGGEAKVYAYHQVSGGVFMTLNGSAANQSAETPYYIVDNLTNPTLTEDETYIVVYNETAGATVGTASLAIHTGSKGVTVLAAYNTGARSGNVLSIAYKAREQCAYGQGLSFKIDHGTEPIYGMGSRSALELKEGQIEVSGTLEQFYNNSTFASINSSTSELKSMVYELWPAGNVSYIMRATEAKFKGYAMENAADGKLTEKVEFVGKFYSSS